MTNQAAESRNTDTEMTEIAEITGRLAVCYSSILHDVMRQMGFTNFVLPREIQPLFPDRILCGPAFTIEGHIDNQADQHETLLQWTGLLSKAKSGHIWVCQPNNDEIALMGELSAETLQAKGVLGCVIDGGIRDVPFLQKLGFNSWRRFHTPFDVVGKWLPSAVDQTITIGKVEINSGDYLLGDQDGMVCLPRSRALEIIEQAEISMHTENKVRTAIINGTDPQQAYLQFNKF